MSFKYINPGYNPEMKQAPQQSGNSIETRTGVYFADFYRVEIPIPYLLSKDLYILFDLRFWAYDTYIGANNRISSTLTATSGYGVGVNSNKAFIIISNKAVQLGYVDSNSKAITHFWYHVHVDDNLEDSYTEYKIYPVQPSTYPVYKGIIRHSEIEDVTHSSFRQEKKLHIYTGGVKNYYSNIILSDEYISPDERVIAVPISSTKTDMTADGDNYVASNVGETLLQTADISSLSAQYGSDTKVTGISLIAYPGYRTGADITTLTSISKQNDTITEHYANSPLATVSSGILNSFATDITIAELAEVQFGWRAGE